MEKYAYLAIISACLLSTFIFSFYKKRAFYKDWKYFIPANIVISFLFIIWDIWFTKIGVWGFNPDYLIGINLFYLPIEEVLFFFCIPYSCTFLFFSITYLIRRNLLKPYSKHITYLLIFVLIACAVLNIDQLYTFITFGLTIIFLIYCLISNIKLEYIYLSYLFILPFFFISNGILTGSFIEEPIVWYNNNENLGLRIFTIPIEDSVYGFLLISTNILLYQYIKNKISDRGNS